MVRIHAVPLTLMEIIMTQASTPTGIGSNINAADPKSLDISWTGPIADGNGKFDIQFVSRQNRNAAPVPAPGSPFTVTGTGTGGAAFTTNVVFPTEAAAKNFHDNYQAQVRADATDPENDSAWGMQIWWDIGFSITVTIGGTSLTLKELPSGIYSLPVSVANPLVVTYADLKTFVANLPGSLAMPTDFPNGKPIAGNLAVTAFAIDTTAKTFEFDFMVNIEWEILKGLTVNSIGLDIQRSNGSDLLAA
jgi:hypothetical protein